MTELRAERKQHARFLWLYAMAAAGGAVAYVPFLTILLPAKVSVLANGQEISWLAYITLSGAIAASVTNIGFGWLSDLTGSRRRWIWMGLIASSIMLVATSLASTLPQLVIAVIGWQIGLNMLLAPLAAWAGDRVPDAQKGFLGGLLAFAPAIGAGTGALVTLPGIADRETQLALVAALVALLVLPVLLFGKPHTFPELREDGPMQDRKGIVAIAKGATGRMWVARLLVQIAEAALFAYLLIWFRSISRSIQDNEVAQLFGLVLALAVPIALLAGRWSDRVDRPILPLSITAAMSSIGLVLMAWAGSTAEAIGGFVVFGLSASVFLSLHTGQTLRVLPMPSTRGRDLGVFNLTNTVPSLIMPWLTLALVPSLGFDALFYLLAALVLVAAILLATLARK